MNRVFSKVYQILFLLSVCISLNAQIDTEDNFLSSSETGGCPTGSEVIAPLNADFENEVIHLLNQLRIDLGLAPLKLNSNISQASRYHAKSMTDNNYFAHASQDAAGYQVCTAFDRLYAFYQWNGAAENIAAGQTSPAIAHLGWVNSAGHYNNMINTNFREVGAGYYQSTSATYGTRWVVDFGIRINVFPLIINNEAVSTESTTVELYLYGEDDFDEMRLRNDGEAWGEWEPFQNVVSEWDLKAEIGTRTVEVEMRNAGDSTVNSTSDEIYLEDIPSSGGGTSTFELSAKAFLEGPCGSINGLMTTTISENYLMPLEQPYSRDPWNYTGVESVANTDEIPIHAVDWILVDILDSDFNLVERKAGMLLDDGSIVKHDDINSGIRFETLDASTSYYVALRHRNHLAVVSANTLQLPNSVELDFTRIENVLGGTVAAGPDNAYYTLHAGDFDSNGVITASDYNFYSIEASMLDVYIDSDCNLDRTATVSDFNLYSRNSSIIGVPAIQY